MNIYHKDEEELLTIALEKVKSKISQEDYKDVQDYIYYGECGLGWELLWYLVHERYLLHEDKLFVSDELILSGKKMGFGVPNWLRGSSGNAARVPYLVCGVDGEEFRDFDHFQQKFWKVVANDLALSKQFSQRNLSEMKKGHAPFAPSTQQVGGRQRYEIDYNKGLQNGRNVCHTKIFVKGNAPYELITRQVRGRIRYEIAFSKELEDGENVYRKKDLVIRTPLNHIRGK